MPRSDEAKRFPGLSKDIRTALETGGFKVISVRRKSAMAIRVSVRRGESNGKALRQAAFRCALEVVRQYAGEKPKIDIEVV